MKFRFTAVIEILNRQKVVMNDQGYKEGSVKIIIYSGFVV